MSSDVIRANVEVHSRMVEVYQKEPHFRPENQARVRNILSALRRRATGGRLLDLGCGTGFIIDLARDLFDEIQGGLHSVEFRTAALDCGFSECDVHFEWFLGQGAVMHGQSFEAAETYLRRALPLTSHLFKYLQIMVGK
jgi:hypothetical protein